MPKKNPSKKTEKVVMVSGGFDPIHPGHVRMFAEAKRLGDRLVVVINNDHWIRAKKGRGFMSAKDRAEIISSFRDVDDVVISSHKRNLKSPKDMSICRELLKIKPHIFANGGDRNIKDSKDSESSLYSEIELCKRLGVRQIFNVGKGGKIRSSSELLNKYVQKKSKLKKRIS